MSPQEIAKKLGIQLQEEPNLDKLMKYDSRNTFACDEKDNVIGLNVCGNELTDEKAAPIWQLSKLQALNLSENQLSAVTIPKRMKDLRRLNLSENASLQAFSFEEGLPTLEEAGLSECGLTAVAFPEGFEALHTLELQKNKLKRVTFAAACPALERLDLSDNQLASFTLPAGFKGLHSLYLNNNQLTTLSFNGRLPSLNTLHLQGNQLATIEAQEGLPVLETLNLQNNKVNGLQFLVGSPALQNLNLVKNAVTDLSPVRGLIEKGVPVQWKDSNGIAVEDNPLTAPPPEVVKEGNEAILNYFREIDIQGVDTLYEAKLLIVGEGGAGKTSLCRRLFFPNKPLPEPEETTRGIDIHQYEFPMENGRPFRINVWDFGGQQIYHATHQFFLTKRSLYILLDDTKRDDRSVHDEAFKYWLEVIELLGGDSPVLIFQNEKGGRSKSIDFPGIKGRFNNVKDLYHGDLSQKDSVGPVKDAIAFHVKHLPHFGESLPKKWIDIRAEVQEMANEEPYITQRKYLDIYKKHLGFDRVKALVLSRYLHDLGVFLHFQDDEILSRTVILQNTWATEAVFKILDDEAVKGNMGRFDVEDCQRVWADSVYADMHPELRALMMKFELCYLLADTRSKTWLAPQLLPPSKPDGLEGWDEPGILSLRYHYDFLPKGLVNRLMVRQNRFVQRPGLGWKSGALFEREGTDLLVEMSEKGDEIILRARGPERKELLSIIAGDLEALNSTFSGLSAKVNKKVPCNCGKCRESASPEFYPYRRLVKRKADNRLVMECPASYEVVSVLELLDGIYTNVADIGELQDVPEMQDSRMAKFEGDDVKAPGPLQTAPLPSLDAIPSKEGPARILFVAANPTDQARIQTDREHRRLVAELERGRSSDRFTFLRPQIAVTINELVRAMNDKPHLIHFSGHGFKDGIIITTEDNKSQAMPIRALMRLFRPLHNTTEIVILNACYSAEQAKVISEYGIFVVGNNLPITDPAAISFSEGFYNGLGEGKSFEEAFNDAMIVVETNNPEAADIIEVWRDGKKLNL
ncbi:MAG: leucine-rich repeat domain-containing protein [Lewinellaceae bacterium]|nr:leucine-rich repeat domain-containing protein [Lewinellaceae bacterium]